VNFQNSDQLAGALVRALESAINSPDLSQIEAVHSIIEQERFQGFEGLRRSVQQNPVDFVLVAAPGFCTSLKRATGFTRDEWAQTLP